MRISVWSSNVCSSDLSKGEPLSGQLAVANVIMNRVESGRFPSTICGVVTQRDQFSFVRGGKIPAIDTNRKAYRTAMAVAQVAMADDWSKDPAPEALFFQDRKSTRLNSSH